MSIANDETYTYRGIESLVEVDIIDQNNFLKIKETLTRIGIPSYKDKKIFQSCHILQKRGKYYIVHFKELFILDGKKNTITDEDWARRNTIINLLEDWNLIKIKIENQTDEPVLPLSKIKIIKFQEKGDWDLVPKYTIGKKKKKDETNESTTAIPQTEEDSE